MLWFWEYKVESGYGSLDKFLKEQYDNGFKTIDDARCLLGPLSRWAVDREAELSFINDHIWIIDECGVEIASLILKTRAQ